MISSESEVHDDGFAVSTRVGGSPESLYEAWTTKAGLEGWLATIAEVDARVGGRYVLRWPSPDGELSARGEYKELVPGQKVVLTWESWGPEGRFEGGDANVRVEFRGLGDGSTEMVQTEWGPSYSDRSKIEMSMSGTIQAHEALARFVESSEV